MGVGAAVGVDAGVDGLLHGDRHDHPAERGDDGERERDAEALTDLRRQLQARACSVLQTLVRADASIAEPVPVSSRAASSTSSRPSCADCLLLLLVGHRAAASSS